MRCPGSGLALPSALGLEVLASASAIAKVLAGTTWQRCRVHFMRNLLSSVPKG